MGKILITKNTMVGVNEREASASRLFSVIPAVGGRRKPP
jgi:hypothetical protein